MERTDTGEKFEEEAEVVIVARGALNDAKWPDVRGLDTFKGEVMHSAAWNQEYVHTKPSPRLTRKHSVIKEIYELTVLE